MEAKEIIEFLYSLDLSKDKLGHSCTYDNKLITDKCGKIEYYEEGTRELLNPDSIVSVIYFEDHNVYIGMFGYYDSWNGSSFDDSELIEVEPKKIEITIFEEKIKL